MHRVTGALATCERAIPSSRIVEDLIRSRRPDAVLVTPLVTDRSPQVDVIKSAQALGIPAALCVASWDHLTTKGLIRVQPDLVSVWNEQQKAEALAYHATDPASIVVTGAQPFDRWFERRPTPRADFCRKVGLPADQPIVLFVGSTKSISAPDAELQFVRRWIAALRAHPSLSGVSILVRPHPFNSRHWSEEDVADLSNVAVYPHWANPVNEADRQDYFDSLYHSEAVVGINTTAMIEAAIVGRTVHSVLADEFKDTQGGTLHFRYLLAENGGFLRVGANLSEHAEQVAETLASPGIGREACARFVRTFVRPRGIDVPTTPILVEALERLASSARAQDADAAVAVPAARASCGSSGVLAYYPKRAVEPGAQAVADRRETDAPGPQAAPTHFSPRGATSIRDRTCLDARSGNDEQRSDQFDDDAGAGGSAGSAARSAGVQELRPRARARTRDARADRRRARVSSRAPTGRRSWRRSNTCWTRRRSSSRSCVSTRIGSPACARMTTGRRRHARRRSSPRS